MQSGASTPSAVGRPRRSERAARSPVAGRAACSSAGSAALGDRPPASDPGQGDRGPGVWTPGRHGGQPYGATVEHRPGGPLFAQRRSGVLHCGVHVIVVGCGRVGSGLAISLSAEGHSVAIIDKTPGPSGA